MKNLRNLFIRWYFNQFADRDALHVAMDQVCEDSPWHREATVAIHTNMVVAEYISRVQKDTWHFRDLYGAFACAFHDVGKPEARTEAYKPERGTYYRYGGHELISARLWEDWAVRNWKFLETEFGINLVAIYHIGWIIENHLPWDIKKAEKRKRLASGAAECAGNTQAFINVLKADTYGRISDDETEKRAKTEEWCEEFTALVTDTRSDREAVRLANVDKPTLYLPIAVSGSGKSTLLNSEAMKCINKGDGGSGDMIHFSMDELRLKWYDKDDYSHAFELACADKDFNNNVRLAFQFAINEGRDIFADNMNLSRKSRAQYIQSARSHGYRIAAILLPIALNTVLQRASTRKDKSVPRGVVEDMYMRLALPTIGEVDDVIVYSGNLEHPDD